MTYKAGKPYLEECGHCGERIDKLPEDMEGYFTCVPCDYFLCLNCADRVIEKLNTKFTRCSSSSPPYDICLHAFK